jgi:CRP/FNR family cyclic AMP-dependent transcriptional regulator
MSDSWSHNSQNVTIDSVEDIAKLLPTRSTKRSVKKRSILIYQGEVPRQAYIVLSGVFKAYRLGNFGEEQVVGFRTKGDMFPETWIFGKTSSALYYYEALEDSEVLTVERPVLLELIDANPDIKERVFHYMVNGYTGLLMQLTALEQSRAAEKLLLMMYYLMFRYGKQVTAGTYRVDLRLTHTTLGSLMGLTRETTTMELGRLKRKKVINYDSKGFVIYRQELERRLGDESFSSLNLQ